MNEQQETKKTYEEQLRVAFRQAILMYNHMHEEVEKFYAPLVEMALKEKDFKKATELIDRCPDGVVCGTLLGMLWEAQREQGLHGQAN